MFKWKDDNNNNFQYVCSSDHIPNGQSRVYSITDKQSSSNYNNNNGGGGKIEIAIFNIGGTFHAISNICIHKGGPLSDGILEGDIITCPWHGWKYSVKNGKSPHEGGDSISSYPVYVSKEGRIYVSPIPKNVGKRVSEPH